MSYAKINVHVDVADNDAYLNPLIQSQFAAYESAASTAHAYQRIVLSVPEAGQISLSAIATEAYATINHLVVKNRSTVDTLYVDYYTQIGSVTGTHTVAQDGDYIKFTGPVGSNFINQGAGFAEYLNIVAAPTDYSGSTLINSISQARIGSVSVEGTKGSAASSIVGTVYMLSKNVISVLPGAFAVVSSVYTERAPASSAYNVPVSIFGAANQSAAIHADIILLGT